MFLKVFNIALSILVAFSSLSVPQVHAQQLLGLPEPGVMVSLSPAYQPTLIKGVTINKDNPFLFDFIVDVGQDKMEGNQLKAEGEKLIKYFLAGLAIPEKDLWVNLSPYEKDRTIPEALSQTEMGRDLLAQDYLLKQITASLIYPEKDLGKAFWDKVYAKAQAQFGTTDIPVNTFNKVWIMADQAEVFERNQTAFVTKAHLKVMLEEDYLAKTKSKKSEDVPNISSHIIKEIVLPELEKEINEGRNFAPLRQIYHSLILAGWYKNNLKEALINQVYTDKSKINGINTNDAKTNQQIYERYLSAYKKGVFNYIKEDKSATQTAPRKYFSGGMTQLKIKPDVTNNSEAMTSIRLDETYNFKTILSEPDKAMVKEEAISTETEMAARKLINWLVFERRPSEKSQVNTLWMARYAVLKNKNYFLKLREGDIAVRRAADAVSYTIDQPFDLVGQYSTMMEILQAGRIILSLKGGGFSRQQKAIANVVKVMNTIKGKVIQKNVFSRSTQMPNSHYFLAAKTVLENQDIKDFESLHKTAEEIFEAIYWSSKRLDSSNPRLGAIRMFSNIAWIWIWTYNKKNPSNFKKFVQEAGWQDDWLEKVVFSNRNGVLQREVLNLDSPIAHKDIFIEGVKERLKDKTFDVGAEAATLLNYTADLAMTGSDPIDSIDANSKENLRIFTEASQFISRNALEFQWHIPFDYRKTNEAVNLKVYGEYLRQRGVETPTGIKAFELLKSALKPIEEENNDDDYEEEFRSLSASQVILSLSNNSEVPLKEADFKIAAKNVVTMLKRVRTNGLQTIVKERISEAQHRNHKVPKETFQIASMAFMENAKKPYFKDYLEFRPFAEQILWMISSGRVSASMPSRMYIGAANGEENFRWSPDQIMDFISRNPSEEVSTAVLTIMARFKYDFKLTANQKQDIIDRLSSKLTDSTFGLKVAVALSEYLASVSPDPMSVIESIHPRSGIKLKQAHISYNHQIVLDKITQILDYMQDARIVAQKDGTWSVFLFLHWGKNNLLLSILNAVVSKFGLECKLEEERTRTPQLWEKEVNLYGWYLVNQKPQNTVPRNEDLELALLKEKVNRIKSLLTVLIQYIKSVSDHAMSVQQMTPDQIREAFKKKEQFYDRHEHPIRTTDELNWALMGTGPIKDKDLNVVWQLPTKSAAMVAYRGGMIKDLVDKLNAILNKKYKFNEGAQRIKLKIEMPMPSGEINRKIALESPFFSPGVVSLGYGVQPKDDREERTLIYSVVNMQSFKPYKFLSAFQDMTAEMGWVPADFWKQGQLAADLGIQEKNEAMSTDELGISIVYNPTMAKKRSYDETYKLTGISKENFNHLNEKRVILKTTDGKVFIHDAIPILEVINHFQTQKPIELVTDIHRDLTEHSKSFKDIPFADYLSLVKKTLDVEAAPGGIDLSDSTDIIIQKEGSGVAINFNKEMVDRIRKEGLNGLTPNIIEVKPVQSIWPLLGLDPHFSVANHN
jgi:hypothetical protein